MITTADCYKSPAGLRSRYWSVDDVEPAEVERRQDGIHLARHTSAVSEGQFVTTADKRPVHHAAEQSS